MTTSTKQNPAGERVEEPAKRWRNWGRVTDPVIGVVGSVQCGLVTWPSKDVAEQKALDGFESALRIFGRPVANYLGAFPEGQRP